MGGPQSKPFRVFPIRRESLQTDQAGSKPSGQALAGPESSTPADLCSAGESFALMVLGDSMLPEFAQGEVIIIEPDGLAADGSFVLAQAAGEWIFRQLCRTETGWTLRPLNPTYPEVRLTDLAAVRGVIIQKSLPGRRRASKRYVA
ncbi:MAG: S24 family peptidase [Quisquiliibacterium sp.]